MMQPAVASHIAIGGYAAGHMAIGDPVKGAVALTAPEHHLGAVRAGQVKQLMEQVPQAVEAYR